MIENIGAAVLFQEFLHVLTPDGRTVSCHETAISTPITFCIVFQVSLNKQLGFAGEMIGEVWINFGDSRFAGNVDFEVDRVGRHIGLDFIRHIGIFHDCLGLLFTGSIDIADCYVEEFEPVL